MSRDTIYEEGASEPGSFRFDEQVAGVFADMIERSVPGYALTLEMLGVIARRYGRPDTLVYDLGCSLGASTLSLRGQLPRGTRIVAIDNAPAMTDACREHVSRDPSNIPVEVVCADILTTTFETASISVMNFTLQFIPLAERDGLIERIADATCPGGVLVLSEKIAFPDAFENDTLLELHHEFKRHKGYSDLEIAGKRSALEDVLVPETIEVHRNRLRAAGFARVATWFQCFNFVSMIALR